MRASQIAHLVLALLACVAVVAAGGRKAGGNGKGKGVAGDQERGRGRGRGRGGRGGRGGGPARAAYAGPSAPAPVISLEALHVVKNAIVDSVAAATASHKRARSASPDHYYRSRSTSSRYEDDRERDRQARDRYYRESSPYVGEDTVYFKDGTQIPRADWTPRTDTGSVASAMRKARI